MYKRRKITSKICNFIDSDEVIVLHGSRQVGKTTLLKILMDILLERSIPQENIIYFDLEDFVLLDLCNQGIKEVIQYIESKKVSSEHKIYLFIDEIQYLERPSSFLKIFYDHHKSRYKLFVSGSSSFNIRSKFKDSLVGRTIDFEIFGLDFEEFLYFKDQKYDLKAVQNGTTHDELIKLYSEYIIYGGYPRVVLEKNKENKEVYLKQVINTYVKKDIGDYARVRNIQKFNNLIRILADQSGSLLNVIELSNTVGLSRQTIDEYLFILENTYIIKLVPPYFNNIRSELSKKPKILFEDTGLLNILQYGTFVSKIGGSIFETSIYSLLRKNCDIDTIKFWRTTSKKEIDIIIDKIKLLMAIEVKLTYTGQSSSALQYFTSFYKDKKKNVSVEPIIVTLHKNRVIEDASNRLLYPWELYREGII